MGLPLTDDELLLTLWAYRQIGLESSFSAQDPTIQWLSRTLKSLPIHPPRERPAGEEFHSPNALAKRIRQFQYIAANTDES